ncbi:hypothetical protein KSP39_PZI008008 [Platanthera zijinensis]|uniref:Uncharacterized protein n=1 Tax=Platanthera zijinensis TaxID=2320716 RepID=A0AAP0G8H3_9ASPA
MGSPALSAFLWFLLVLPCSAFHISDDRLNLDINFQILGSHIIKFSFIFFSPASDSITLGTRLFLFSHENYLLFFSLLLSLELLLFGTWKGRKGKVHESVIFGSKWRFCFQEIENGDRESYGLEINV